MSAPFLAQFDRGHRVTDRAAVARAGCSNRTDHDQGEKYDGEAALWSLADEPEVVVGRCDCGSLILNDPWGLGVNGCGWCGARYPWPEEGQG